MYKYRSGIDKRINRCISYALKVPVKCIEISKKLCGHTLHTEKVVASLGNHPGRSLNFLVHLFLNHLFTSFFSLARNPHLYTQKVQDKNCSPENFSPCQILYCFLYNINWRESDAFSNFPPFFCIPIMSRIGFLKILCKHPSKPDACSHFSLIFTPCPVNPFSP